MKEVRGHRSRLKAAFFKCTKCQPRHSAKPIRLTRCTVFCSSGSWKRERRDNKSFGSLHFRKQGSQESHPTHAKPIS